MAPWSGLWASRAVLAGTLVVVKMEKPNWSISEIDDGEDDDDFLAGAGTRGRQRRRRGKNAKQTTWVLLLKAHRAAGCLAWLASAAIALWGPARRRVAAGRTDSTTVEEERSRSRFYAFIRALLLLSVLLLAVELAAYANQNFQVHGGRERVASGRGDGRRTRLLSRLSCLCLSRPVRLGQAGHDCVIGSCHTKDLGNSNI